MPKTRNAFAFRNFNHKKLFNIFKAREVDLTNKKERDRMRIECRNALLRFGKIRMRLENHIARLNRYCLKIGNHRFLKIEHRYLELYLAYTKFHSQVCGVANEVLIFTKQVDFYDRKGIIRFFSQRLQEARRSAGLTQEELAQRLGVRRSTYGQYEQGRNEPNISILPALTRELGLPVEWFLGNQDE